MTLEMYAVLQEHKLIETQQPYKQWDVGPYTVVMVKVRAHKAVLKLIQEYSEQFFKDYYSNLKTDKGEAPVGKQTVKGRIVFTKLEETFYGPAAKMMVELPNKSTVYGTLPKCIPLDHRGDIEFTATFNCGNDNTHAFFKRPTKASVC